MVEDKILNAGEARDLADTSGYTLKHIYKHIKECATENKTTFEWFYNDFSSVAKERAIENLHIAGYTVVDTDNSLIISW